MKAKSVIVDKVHNVLVITRPDGLIENIEYEPGSIEVWEEEDFENAERLMEEGGGCGFARKISEQIHVHY